MAYSTDTSSSPPKKSSGKMTDKQKADLKKHMDKHKKDMSPSEQKSHRMKMISRMRRGDSIAKAHKAIMGK
jgi:ribosomal protein S15P/S13E